MWNEDLNSIILPTLSTMIFFIFTINFFRYLVGSPHIQIRDVTKEHNWKTISGVTKVLLGIYKPILRSSLIFFIKTKISSILK